MARHEPASDGRWRGWLNIRTARLEWALVHLLEAVAWPRVARDSEGHYRRRQWVRDDGGDVAMVDDGSIKGEGRA